MSTVQQEKPVFAEVSESGKAIEIYFKPSPRWLQVMHDLEAVFIPKDRLEKVGGERPHWRIPLDYFAAKKMADAVGEKNLELGEALDEWARVHYDTEADLIEILSSDDYKLTRLPKVLPEMYKWYRPYQRVAVAYGAYVLRHLNASKPGLGKTPETIGVIYETENEEAGPSLVVAPKTSLESVWEQQLTRFGQKVPVIRANGDGVRRFERYHWIHEAELAHSIGRPFFLLVNPDMVRYRKIDPEQDAVKDNLRPEFEFLYEIVWRNIVLDEVQKNGLRNVGTVTAKGILDLQYDEEGVRAALSGTPAGGKMVNLFGVLHWLDPIAFSSKYKWAQRWMTVELEAGRKGEKPHTVIGDVLEEKEDEFTRHLLPYMIRHTKEEVLPQLPPKDEQELWVSMTEAQKVQYDRFATMAEIELGDKTLTATNILAIYTRLKQFAGAKLRFEDEKLIPTEDSPKLHLVEEKLDELGIMDGSGEAQAIISSQFEGMVRMMYDYLVKKGVACTLLVGKTKNRTDTINSFQAGEAKVILMTHTTGGVSIDLDAADTVFLLDEWWDPDVQEQVADRAHRASRMHQVTVYFIRTKDTIEESIRDMTGHKGRVNKRLLDNRKISVFGKRKGGGK